MIYSKYIWLALWLLVGIAFCFQLLSVALNSSAKPESPTMTSNQPDIKKIVKTEQNVSSSTPPKADQNWKEWLQILQKDKKYQKWLNDKKRLERLWSNPPSFGFQRCTEESPEFKASKLNFSRGFLLVNANGGLNQMKAGICDMVVIARLLNATLVIPELDKKSYWKDSSTFEDIFDVAHFIKSLKNDVPIIEKLPEDFQYAEAVRLYFESWATAEYYQNVIGQNWIQYKVIHALKSDSRLSNNLPLDLQKLRCRTHFEALKFSPEIEDLGKKLVERMRSQGPFVALHLRFEKDMLAFSGCTFTLSREEAEELTAVRMATKHWRVKSLDPNSQRVQGLCPLSPAEVAFFFLSLGFPRSLRIYVASGEIFGGEKTLGDLKAVFPNLLKKENLASEKELENFKGHQNKMAALDFLVSIHSDIFLATYPGNMARAVEGHRRFMGHKRTISPDSKGIVKLFEDLHRGEKEWGPTFWEEVELIHMHSQGGPRPRKGPKRGTHGKDKHKTEESFYSNPLPECLCQEDKYKIKGGLATAMRRGPPKKRNNVTVSAPTTKTVKIKGV